MEVSKFMNSTSLHEHRNKFTHKNKHLPEIGCFKFNPRAIIISTTKELTVQRRSSIPSRI